MLYRVVVVALLLAIQKQTIFTIARATMTTLVKDTVEFFTLLKGTVKGAASTIFFLSLDIYIAHNDLIYIFICRPAMLGHLMPCLIRFP